MKNFVKTIQRAHTERFSVVMNNIIAKKIPVAFLLIAPTDQDVEAVKNFRAQGLNVTNLIVVDDDFPEFDVNFNVIHLRYAAQIFPQPEYIFAVDDIGTRVAIKNFPNSKVLSLNRGDSDYIYQMFMRHLDDLREVYESLIDEESKKVFCGYWLGIISQRLNEFVYANTPHYICAGFIPERDAIVIEGGTCDGGTAAIFSARGYNVYSFEMDKKNYEYCRKIAEEKNFVVENFGLGSYNHEAAYNSNWGSSNLAKGGTETAQIITLDSYVDEKKLPRVDFIKMDVEGAELDILKGAAMTIARYKPILALSAYHKLDDFWTLTNFIKSLRPDYEFALRQCADTYEEVPSVYSEKDRDFAVSLGLEPEFRSWWECVLFAR